MGTSVGFDLLQFVADNAADWHDRIAVGNEPQGSVMVMTALIDAQNKMFLGRRLRGNAREAKDLFYQWAYAYDRIFLEGQKLGVVPHDAG